MKSILISVQPKWCAKILSGEKTEEIRKRFPKDYRGWVYIYCCQNEYLYRTNKDYFASKKKLEVGKGTEYTYAYSDEGKVVARFYCDKVEEIRFTESEWKGTTETPALAILDKSCLTYDEIANYLKGNGYAIHISDLEIYVRPRELDEFYPIKWNKCGVKDKDGSYQCDKCPYGGDWQRGCRYKPLTKAPQSYMFIESEN